MVMARWTATVQDAEGNAVPGCEIEVRNANTGLLTQVYSDRDGTVPLGNPFVSADATFGFHVVGGAYRITARKGSFQALWNYVGIGTMGEFDFESIAFELEAGLYPVATLADLNAYVPGAEQSIAGIVLNDPDPSNNGYYLWSGAVWEWQRGLPDTIARLTVIGGTENALEVQASEGVDPGSVLAFFIDPPTPNTGPVTIKINGDDPVPAHDYTGEDFVPGAFSGRVFLSREQDGSLRSLMPADLAARAAQSASEAAADADRAETYAAMLSVDRIKFNTVAALLADTSMGYAGSGASIIVGPGDIIEAQGFRYEVAASGATDAPIKTQGGVKLIPLRDIAGLLNAGSFGYVTETDQDMRPALQAAIDYAESLDEGIVTVVIPSGRVLLKSLCPDADLPTDLSGQKVGLVLRKPRWVRLWGLGAEVSFDLNESAVQAADVLFAVAPEATGDSALLYLEGISFYGSVEAEDHDRSLWPKNTFRADYDTMAYASLRDMNLYFAREDNFVIRGFVVEMTNIRARFAGDQHSNFFFDAKNAGGAVTAYYLERCVADYAGLYGYRFSGEAGHTYCHLDTCAADHVGRDLNNQTITGNELTSFAYSFENVRNMVMTACGAEWCNSSVRLHNARTFVIDGFYGVANGSTNSVTVPSSIVCSGFFERVNIASFEENSSSNIAKRLRLESVSLFNNNALTLDHSIRREDIEFVGGAKSSARTLVSTPNDWYRDGNRWDGGVVVYGDRLPGNPGNSWFDRNNTVARQTFRAAVPAGGGGIPILQITDTSSDGNLWVSLRVIVARNSGGNYPPSVYQVAAACQGTNRTATAEKVGSIGFGFTVSANWSGDVLQVVVGQEFATVFVEATVMAAQNTANGKFFQWS